MVYEENLSGLVSSVVGAFVQLASYGIKEQDKSIAQSNAKIIAGVNEATRQRIENELLQAQEKKKLLLEDLSYKKSEKFKSQVSMGIVILTGGALALILSRRKNPCK